jgi:hypothetical protein
MNDIPAQSVLCRHLASFDNKGWQKAVFEVAVDPPSQVMMFSVYTDDGAGNGNCVLSLPLANLIRLAADIGALG